ncbi:MAG TPA: carbohydrate ABC transporter permease [Catenuloplanes sp.]|jgi:xylobiose transport system permease protein
MTGAATLAAPPLTDPADGAGAPVRRNRRARRRPHLLAGLGAVIWLGIVGLPLYSLVSNTVRRRDDYLDSGPLALPRSWSWHNYVEVFDNGFLRYLGNTVIVTVGTVAFVLLLAVPTGYAIVRSRSRLVSVGFRVFLLGLAIPAQATIIPLYLMITRANLYDSLLAVILPTAAFSLPVAVLILSSSMRDISEELYEAMALDGASTRRVLWSLVLPMSKAGIGTVGIYSALSAWNGFLFPLILTQAADRRVLTMALWDYQTEYGVNIPALMTAVLLSALPIFVAYLLMRRTLVNGLMGVGGK